MSATLRLCIAVAIVAGICMSAATAQTCSTTDPDLLHQGVSGSQNCAPARYCFNELCDCLLGATAAATHYNKSDSVVLCLGAATAAPCDRRAECLARTYGCLLNAADMFRNDATCSAWAAPIHLSYLAFASTNNLTASSVYKACTRAVCQLANASTNPKGCDTTRDAQLCTCASPLNTKVSFPLTGDWSTAASTEDKRAALRKAIEDDLAKKAGAKVCVVSVTLGADKTLLVVVNIPLGVSPNALDTITGADFTSTAAASGMPIVVGPITKGPTVGATPTPGTPSPSGTPTPGTPAPASASRVSAVLAVLVAAALSFVA